MNKFDNFQDILKLGFYRVIFVSCGFFFNKYNRFYVDIPNLCPYIKVHLSTYMSSLTLRFQQENGINKPFEEISTNGH